MKINYVLSILILSLSAPIAGGQKWIINTSRGIGATAGALGGAIGGAGIGYPIGTHVARRQAIDALKIKHPDEDPFEWDAEDLGYPSENTGGLVYGAAIGGSTGALGGLYVGDQLGKYAARKWYNVSKKLLNVANLFNLSLDKYKNLLVAAEAKNDRAIRPELAKAMQNIYGRTWKKRLSKIISEYEAVPTAFETLYMGHKLAHINQLFDIFVAVSTLYNNQPIKGYSFTQVMDTFIEFYDKFLK